MKFFLTFLIPILIVSALALFYGLLTGKTAERKIKNMISAEEILIKIWNNAIFLLLAFFFFAAVLDGFDIKVMDLIRYLPSFML